MNAKYVKYNSHLLSYIFFIVLSFQAIAGGNDGTVPFPWKTPDWGKLDAQVIHFSEEKAVVNKTCKVTQCRIGAGSWCCDKAKRKCDYDNLGCKY